MSFPVPSAWSRSERAATALFSLCTACITDLDGFVGGEHEVDPLAESDGGVPVSVNTPVRHDGGVGLTGGALAIQRHVSLHHHGAVWREKEREREGEEGEGVCARLLCATDECEPVWMVSRGTSVRIRFGSPFSSKVVVCGH